MRKFNHEGWCDCINGISDTCNCIISHPLEVIENLEAALKDMKEALEFYVYITADEKDEDCTEETTLANVHLSHFDKKKSQNISREYQYKRPWKRAREVLNKHKDVLCVTIFQN